VYSSTCEHSVHTIFHISRKDLELTGKKIKKQNMGGDHEEQMKRAKREEKGGEGVTDVLVMTLRP
jgi:hypothetical protein